ncbi:SPOR domain-containing protein [Streptomyces sp. NPDC005859]|uniref:SPOR domain-containing protein n=1 Tax=unclassified Streptomyces TaxID=2593676 RepID=UPI003410A2CF
MNDSTISLPWLVIRQDDNGNRYRVGRYASRAEAQEIADSLDSRGHKQLYWVERIGQGQSQAQAQNGDGTRN